MQRQREPDAKESTGSQKTSKLPLSKRLMSGLILLWGVISTLALIPLKGESHYLEDYITAATLILQGVFCFLGGVFSLLRHRSIARFCLYAVAFCLMLLGTGAALSQRHQGNPAATPMMLAFSLVVFLFGVAFVFWGRWLSSKDEA
jgi:cation transport ATPase